jgi:thioredoxin reductase (NADPH)
MFDIAIIGAGPAGLSAAITARVRNKEVIVVSNSHNDMPLAKASRVDNYPGMPKASGIEILEAMAAQAESLGATIERARATSVLPTSFGDAATTFAVTTSKDHFEARSIILAVGANTAGDLLPGEAELLGRGVSYCATCDGMFYRNSEVCLYGLSADAFMEALFMLELGAKVHYVTQGPTEGLLALVPDESKGAIEIIKGSIEAVTGDEHAVTGAIVAPSPEGVPAAQAEKRHIPCKGVFLLRPSITPSSLLSGLSVEGGAIATDSQKQTSIRGVFAAGDCAGKPHQIAKAVGEGQVACLSAVKHLRGLD